MWAFNEIYFRRAREIRAALRPLGSFFFPLDVVGSWNRMYGARGFLQYQFVVPFGREDVVEAALDRLAAPSAHPTLVVLKRLGESHGFLSFASPGWTLAVDLALPSPGLGKTLDDLDRLVADAGGRVYFAKDSRLRPEYVERMYGQLGTWRAVRDRLDPRHRLQSDLARRLRLVPPPT